jgi:hypothetical protein
MDTDLSELTKIVPTLLKVLPNVGVAVLFRRPASHVDALKTGMNSRKW